MTDELLYKYDENKYNLGVLPDEAEKALIEGNKRFVAGRFLKKDFSEEIRLRLSTDLQRPMAVVLTCADSRVAPEVIFDQGLGDIFVVRNAGNVVDSIVLGSIEYAVDQFKIPLILVLGHEKCGAVRCAVDGTETSQNIRTIMDKIIPTVKSVKSSNMNDDVEEIASKVEYENARQSTKRILESSIISRFLEEKKVKVITAKYHLKTGKVEILK